MKPMFPSNLTPQSAAEELIVAQALALYRDSKTIADNAPHGQFLNHAEAAVINKEREFIQLSLQTLAQEKIHDIEKKAKRWNVRSARRKKDTSDMQTSSEVATKSAKASGNVEITIDATKVNTMGGWRDVKVGIVSKRPLGESALPKDYGKRKLPRHTVRIAFAAIEKKDRFRHRLKEWRRRLLPGDAWEDYWRTAN